MFRVIHKFKVPISSAWNGVLLPRNANLIHVGNTYPAWSTPPHASDHLHFWAEIPAELGEEEYIFQEFRVYGTGEPITEPTAAWAGTFIEDGFVWHLYMKDGQPNE